MCSRTFRRFDSFRTCQHTPTLLHQSRKTKTRCPLLESAANETRATRKDKEWAGGPRFSPRQVFRAPHPCAARVGISAPFLHIHSRIAHSFNSRPPAWSIRAESDAGGKLYLLPPIPVRTSRLSHRRLAGGTAPARGHHTDEFSLPFSNLKFPRSCSLRSTCAKTLI